MILFQKIIPEKKTMQTTDYVYIYMCVCMCVDVHVCAFTCVYVLACVCMCPSNTYVMTLKKNCFQHNNIFNIIKKEVELWGGIFSDTRTKPNSYNAMHSGPASYDPVP